jgi:hypothetical protein
VNFHILASKPVGLGRGRGERSFEIQMRMIKVFLQREAWTKGVKPAGLQGSKLSKEGPHMAGSLQPISSARRSAGGLVVWWWGMTLPFRQQAGSLSPPVPGLSLLSQ